MVVSVGRFKKTLTFVRLETSIHIPFSMKNTYRTVAVISSSCLPCSTTTVNHCMQLKYPSWTFPASLLSRSSCFFSMMAVLPLEPTISTISYHRGERRRTTGKNGHTHLHRRKQELYALRMPRQIRIKPRNILLLTNSLLDLHPFVFQSRRRAWAQTGLTLLHFLPKPINRPSTPRRSLSQRNHLRILRFLKFQSFDLN
jgi:hypothetical protein